MQKEEEEEMLEKRPTKRSPEYEILHTIPNIHSAIETEQSLKRADEDKQETTGQEKRLGLQTGDRRQETGDKNKDTKMQNTDE